MGTDHGRRTLDGVFLSPLGLVHGQNAEVAWTLDPASAGKKTNTYCCLKVSPDLFTASLADTDSGDQPSTNSSFALPDGSIQPVPVTNFVKTEIQ